MSDLTITAANVIADPSAKVSSYTAGATITAGQVVYWDSTTSTVKLADSDSATAAARSPIGIALNGAASGQPVQVATSGLVTIGATMTAGLAYYCSKVAGGLCPVADIASGGYATVMGIATSTTVLKVNITESGVAV